VAIAFGTLLGEGSTFGRAALGDDSTRRGYATPSTYSADGRQYVDTAWWLATFPGLCILLTALAFNTLGDRLRDHLQSHRDS